MVLKQRTKSRLRYDFTLSVSLAAHGGGSQSFALFVTVGKYSCTFEEYVDIYMGQLKNLVTKALSFFFSRTFSFV